jgi:hypothetical protein
MGNKLIFNYRRTFGYPFPRCLFIVDEGIFRNRYRPSQNFQKKYLKYKQKYINLKKLL